MLACHPVPAGERGVRSVDVRALRGELDTGDVEEKIATEHSPKFLGLFPGVVYDRELLDTYALQRDLRRVQRFARARGYYEARVLAARVVPAGADTVDVEIVVDEGQAVKLASVSLEGVDGVSAEAKAEARKAIEAELPLQKPFDEASFERAEKALVRALTDRGWASTTSERRAEVDLASHEARIFFKLDPGPVTTVGKVRFEGHDPDDVTAARRVFAVREGDRYSTAELDEGRQALLEEGVYGAVEVTPDLDGARRRGVADVLVKVEPARPRTLSAGLGIEFDLLRADLHGTLGYRHANFLGGFRKFEIKTRPAVIFYPLRTTLAEIDKPLLENRLRSELRQPAFLEHKTTGFVAGEYNVFPVLYPNPIPVVHGYNEVRAQVGLERAFGKLFVTPSYNFEANYPFDYLGTTEGLLPVRISTVELEARLDLRDDRIRPRKGLLLAAEVQASGGPLLGDATDVRLAPEARVYVPLPKKMVLASRAAFGFLFPLNYGDAAQRQYANPDATVPGVDRDFQILFFRGFFAGGPNSNRGYPLRGIGPHSTLGFLIPEVEQLRGLEDCNAPNLNEDQLRNCLLPTGGMSLWEMSAELRVPVTGPLSSAFFCDAGDAAPSRGQLRFDRLHLSCGAGVRYDTPVGPIRLDVAYRIPGLQTLGSSTGERVPDDFFGIPLALAFGIGEAY